MSSEIQFNTPLLYDTSLPQEESQEEGSSLVQTGGNLKASGRRFSYTPSTQPHTPPKTTVKSSHCFKALFPKGVTPIGSQSSPKLLSPDQLSRELHLQASRSSKPSFQKTFGEKPTLSDSAMPRSTRPASPTTLTHTPISLKSEVTLSHAKNPLSQTSKLSHTSTSDKTRESLSKNALFEHKWVHEKTLAFWDKRKEREGGGGQHEHEHRDPQKEKKKDSQKVASIKATTPSTSSLSTSKTLSSYKATKPYLERPKIGVFALYYILTKIGIFSDALANFSHKNEIEKLDSETRAVHKLRLEEMKAALAKERTARQWSMAIKVFSWMSSLMGIVTGIALILTGVGAFAGAMLIVAGVIQLTNQILEITRGWEKIGEKIPGGDPEKRRAILSWIQIGIGILCLILSGISIIWGGYSHFGEAMQTAMGVFGGFISMAQGVTLIGEGISHSEHKNKLGGIKHYELRLAQLKHARKDLMERVESGVDRLEHLFENLAKALEFEVELFQADQLVLRR